MGKGKGDGLTKAGGGAGDDGDAGFEAAGRGGMGRGHCSAMWSKKENEMNGVLRGWEGIWEEEVGKRRGGEAVARLSRETS